MSVALAGRDDIMPAALPRGALAVVLVLAVVLHLAGAALLYWVAQTDGTVAQGEGGLTVGLGPAGTAPGGLDEVAAEPVETTTPEATPPVEASEAPQEVVPPPEATRRPAFVAEAPAPQTPVAPPAPAPDAAPQAAPADSAELAESMDALVAPSATPSVFAPVAPVAPQPAPDTTAPSVADAVIAQPDSPAESISDAAPPETVTATEPQEGLGVSRRPATRPQTVEEAGRQAAAEAAERAEATRDTEEPAPERSVPAGQRGQSAASQSGTRGSGDDSEGGGSPGARADFAAIVAARLAQAKQYPRSAQRARIEGTGTIWFRMNAAGQVTASRLTRGTGHAVLDQAIIETLRRARLPAIPDSVGRVQMEFSVPMSFTLR